jgi:hypothetical protein
MQLGRPILPVLVSDGVNINLLPPPLNEIQIADYRSLDKGAAFALVKSINTAPPPPPLPDPLPTSPRVPVSYLSSLKEQIDSTESLSSQHQKMLLSELEEKLQEGRSPTEVRDLLLSLKRRDDLLAKVATKIDALLKGLEDKASAEPLPQEQHVRHCPRCHMRVEAGSKFCAGCGAGLSESDDAKVQTPIPFPSHKEGAHDVKGSRSRRYLCAPGSTTELIADLKDWLNAKDFDSQEMTTESQSLLLQIKKRGRWREFVGMATALNIVFHQAGDTLTVEIGAGHWIDKAAVGTVSMFILWPLAVSSAFGAWEQMKMPDAIFDYIGARLVHK